jgi:murein DD-endopeptidase MepM/ murein hydrolase activator NlpD
MNRTKVILAVVIIVPIVGGYLGFQWWSQGGGGRRVQTFAWFRDNSLFPEKRMQAGDRCGDAPFVFPTDGIIGFIWGDSFRAGNRHQGLDIFPGTSPGDTPVFAAYPGYLTRLPDWKSSVIIRVPSDPLNPDRQIWTYYTHMADAQGNSFVDAAFPPGTSEVYVETGTLLGYQGNYSGNPANPTGNHLHFSIVEDNGRGSFKNELEISNTIDPSPYFGMALNADINPDEIPVCLTAEES